MQNERVELLRQLDASKGQTGLANESMDKVQASLNHERQANAALRKRQELKSLQEDIQFMISKTGRCLQFDNLEIT